MGRIDVFVDIACPWCYLGKRNLDHARSALGAGFDSQVRWRAYELQPQLPPDGVEAAPFFARKFGGERARDRAFAHVAAAGLRTGIDFRFDLMRRAPNTRLAHRAVAVLRTIAGSEGEQAALEALFEGYFTRGADISDLDQLATLLRRPAAELDVDLDLVLDELAMGGGTTDIEADLALAAQLGVRAVPLYVSEDLRALSGAQPAELLAEFLADTALV